MEQNKYYKGFTAAELREVFSYNPETGEITGGKTYTTNYGYLTKYANKVQFTAARLAWFLHHGELDPSLEIDHINGVRTDNRIINLRVSSRTDQMRNKRLHQNNKTGHCGVFQISPGRFSVSVCGKYYGTHSSAEAAGMVARTIRAKLGFSDRHGEAGHA